MATKKGQWKKHLRGGGLVHVGATVGKGATVGEGAYVAEGATVGKGAYVAEGATDPTVFAKHAAEYRRLRPDIPVVESLDQRMAEVTAIDGQLDMSTWHKCETTHCRAGWAITLAGDDGRKLETKVGPCAAGAMIYRASTGRVPDFFATNERAREDIERCAKESS